MTFIELFLVSNNILLPFYEFLLEVGFTAFPCGKADLETYPTTIR